MASQADIQLPGPPDSANRALFDAMVRHQIYLLRLSGHVRNRIFALLNATEEDIARQIRDRLRNAAGGLDTPAEVRRLETLLRIIRNTRTRAWAQVDEAWVEEALAIANAEPEALKRMVTLAAPVVIEAQLPSPSALRAIVMSRPFEGRTLRQWASSIMAEDLRRIENAIRMGMVAGEPSTVIARRVVGTARLNGLDGVTEITRRNAEAITRTAVNHISNLARAEFIKANSDLFEEEQFVATLDARTTPVCRANDGERFPVGKGPMPPLHFNCRSLRVPALLDDALGNRPAKPVTERMLLREFAKEHGIKAPTSRADLPYGTKGAFDEFARRRIRELTGQIPAKTTYQEWLSRQSAEFQDDVLGPTRAKLFRDGGLTLQKFVNRRGDELTLAELARREASAFRAAGLDPDDYR